MSSGRRRTGGAADTIALLCTALLVLEAGTGFPPDVTVSAYLTAPRLVLLVGLAAVLARDVAQGRSPLTPRPPGRALALVVVLVWRAPLPSWLALLLIGVPGRALGLTFSRAALVGLLLAVGLVMTRRRAWLPLTLAALAVMAVVNPLSTGRLLPRAAGTPTACISRWPRRVGSWRACC